MRFPALVLGAFACLAWLQPGALAQSPRPPEAARPAAPLDPAAIRRDAARRAELRALLADPDPNVRLLAMQAAVKGGDAMLRQTAIEVGLASSEAGLQETALRGMFRDMRVALLEYAEESKAGRSATPLLIQTMDIETGRMKGYIDNLCGTFEGQLAGDRLSFHSERTCRGVLIWQADQGGFSGYLVARDGTRSLVMWKPR